MGVLRDGEIVTIPLRELEEGDEILVLLGENPKNHTSMLHSFLLHISALK